MRIVSDTAILLDVVDLHERDRIVGFLSAEHGRHRGVARSARTKFSQFAGQLQPLAKVHLRWVEKEGSELVRISEVELDRPAPPVQVELEDLLLGSYLAEQVTTFLMEGEPSATHFRLLDTTLEAWLEGVERGVAARYFEVWILRLAGLLPVPRECPLCGRELEAPAFFATEEAALVCVECGDGNAGRLVSAGELAFLRRSGRENLPTLAQERWPPNVLLAVEELCRAIRRSFLNVDLRSDRVLRETMASLASVTRDGHE